MATVVFWAVVGAVLALRVTPLWGIIVGVGAAIVGMAVNVGMLAASTSVLFGAVNTDPGMAGVARAVFFGVMAACVLVGAGVIHALVTGSFWPVKGQS